MTSFRSTAAVLDAVDLVINSNGGRDGVVAAKKNVVSARFDQDERLWAAISPQTWPLAALLKAYPKSGKARKNYEDDLAAMMAQKVTPRLVSTTACSLRIRSAADLAPAIALMK